MADEIYLIEPTIEYADQIWDFRAEILETDADSEDRFAGCLSLDTAASSEEWIRICLLRKSTETCESVGTTVPSSMFLAIRRSDDRLVGIIDLRHHIDHPILGTWGGHCGYSVRPSERGRGYAREMLRLNILKAKEMGIERMLVTCDENNLGSEKAILSNGGVFEKTIEVDGTTMKRYWIPTFRPMRRIKQQLTEEECIEVLKNSKRGVLSILGELGYPYGIPMNHWYCEEDGHIYFHGAKEGHKIDSIQACDKVSFCVMDDGFRKEGEWALNIRSVVVRGRIALVDDPEKTKRIGTALVKKFTDDEEYLEHEVTHALPRAQCLEIIPVYMTGKLVNES